MLARGTGTPVAVALATVEELPTAAQDRADAEYVASRIAAERAIRGVAGDGATTIDVRRRVQRSPLALLRGADGVRRPVALSLTHRDGRAAAIAAPAGSRVGIDLERLGVIEPARQRFFLTRRERGCAEGIGGIGATALWTLKEAVWKALELGPDVSFHELELELDAMELHGIRLRGIHSTAVVGALASPWPGYILATVQLGVDQ